MWAQLVSILGKAAFVHLMPFVLQVAQLEWAQGVSTVENAPTIVAALVMAAHHTVHPDFVFMGSFGTGGKKVGGHGSVTDYVIRLINTTVVSVSCLPAMLCLSLLTCIVVWGRWFVSMILERMVRFALST